MEAYFSGFPLYHPHHKDLGLEPCLISEGYYFAYHPEGDNLEGIDIIATIDKKVEAVLAFESQMRWCAEIEVNRRQRQGLAAEEIDIDQFGPSIADDVRREAAARGADYGVPDAEVMRHLSSENNVLT